MHQAGPWPSPAQVAGAPSGPTLLLDVSRLLGVLLPFRLLLPLDQGLETTQQRDQHAAVLGRHHVLQEPWPQELQRRRRKFGTSAFPSRLRGEKDGLRIPWSPLGSSSGGAGEGWQKHPEGEKWLQQQGAGPLTSVIPSTERSRDSRIPMHWA